MEHPNKLRRAAVAPKNIKELRDDLLDVYNELREGTMQPTEAKEMINAAGKVINTIKCELVYPMIRDRKKISFLEYDEKIELPVKSSTP